MADQPEPEKELPPHPDLCSFEFGDGDLLPDLRIVTILVSMSENGLWSHELDYDDVVSDFEAYAMIEAAYFRMRATVYPGMFPDPTTPPWARVPDDDEDEEGDEPA